jgi:hypothetical protein
VARCAQHQPTNQQVRERVCVCLCACCCVLCLLYAKNESVLIPVSKSMLFNVKRHRSRKIVTIMQAANESMAVSLIVQTRVPSSILPTPIIDINQCHAHHKPCISACSGHCFNSIATWRRRHTGRTLGTQHRNKCRRTLSQPCTSSTCPCVSSMAPSIIPTHMHLVYQRAAAVVLAHCSAYLVDGVGLHECSNECKRHDNYDAQHNSHSTSCIGIDIRCPESTKEDRR